MNCVLLAALLPFCFTLFGYIVLVLANPDLPLALQ